MKSKRNYCRTCVSDSCKHAGSEVRHDCPTEIRRDGADRIDDCYIDFLNEMFTGEVLKEQLENYYRFIGVKFELEEEEPPCAPRFDASNIDAIPRVAKEYRLDIRPLWKNNTENTFETLKRMIYNILSEELEGVTWEESNKCFRFFGSEYCLSMKTIIALQAIGHNNGGYTLGISIVI